MVCGLIIDFRNFNWQGGGKMKESSYNSFDELPLFLNAEILANAIGISPSSAYELMHETSFPSLKIGNRLVVPKEDFINWVKKNTNRKE